MCGLTGILSSASSENIFEKLTDMNACLAHRGPDDEKFGQKMVLDWHIED